MSYFEFLMVLAGIVVAVAMTEIVGGFGRLVRSNAAIKLDGAHMLWSYNALLLAMLYWNGMWPYQSVDIIYVGQIWLLVLPTLALVIVAYALSPNAPDNNPINIREYYLRKRQPIFIGLATFVSLAYLADYAIAGVHALQELLTTLFSVTTFIVLAITVRIVVHWCLAVIMALFLTSAGAQSLAESYARFEPSHSSAQPAGSTPLN
ncbi:MAG: hypothetical protein AAF993_01455 [Pseudomonadota bacterium]